jgi:hypothetical protein
MEASYVMLGVRASCRQARGSVQAWGTFTLLAEMTGSSLIVPRLIKSRGPENPRRSQARLLARTGSPAQGPDLGSYKEFEL